jgi:SAM-dependent methyltransferase
MNNVDDWDAHWSSFGSPTEGHAANRYRARLIVKALGEVRPGSLLIDIGSGQGELAIDLAKKFPELNVLGLENSETGVNRSRLFADKENVSVDFFQRDLLKEENISTTLERRANYAICTEVLEHIDNPSSLLVNAADYLETGAKVIVTVPAGPRTAFDRFIGHRRHYSPKTLSELLKESGYEVDMVKRAGFPFFNLYRIATMIRGKRLIRDLEVANESGRPSRMLNLALRAFDLLFRFNVDNSPFGWQLVATAVVVRNPKEDLEYFA